MENPYKPPRDNLKNHPVSENKGQNIGYLTILLWGVLFSYIVGVVSYLQAGNNLDASLSGGLYFSIEWLAPLLVLSLVTKSIAAFFGRRLSSRNRLIMTVVVFCLVVYAYKETIQYFLMAAGK